MASRSSNDQDRLFVQDGRRFYRRTFSRTEARLGFLILVALAMILVWVAWKGAHPDPNLFALEADLAQPSAVESFDRGPVPIELASAGWSEGALSQFDYDNLYVKINGREGYYKSFGFERLYFLSIILSEDPATAVDIELYDLGTAANAVGAYAGERAPGISPEVTSSGLWHMDRNALFMTRGKYYLRAIGSSESPQVIALLEHLRKRFEMDMPGEPLPWGYSLFVGKMGMDAGAVAFAAENAFSFGFAKTVYWVTLDDEAELFVTPAYIKEEARALAGQFMEGFRQYGEDEGGFVKDRYLGTYSYAEAAGPWVVGIHRASDPGSARKRVDEMAGVVREMPVPERNIEPPGGEDVLKESLESSYDESESGSGTESGGYEASSEEGYDGDA